VIFPGRLHNSPDKAISCFRQAHRWDAPGCRFETVAMRKDGKEFDVDLTMTTTLLPSGEMFHTACIRDISERKRTERALLQAQEQLRRHAEELEQRVLERTNRLTQTIRTLESFSYSVAHDLRAPLRAMHGWAVVIKEDYGDVLDDTGRGYMKRIAHAATKMDLLIHDLLDYSYMSHKQCVSSPLNLESEINIVLEQLVGEIELRNAAIEFEQPLPEVFANAPMLEQALRNLITNAIKFVPSNTQPRVHIRAAETESHVRISVQDNGIGIAPEHHERIFGIFERLHASEIYSGTGIGLALVQKSVERMGGTVGLESEERKGSKFWIELPKKNPEEDQRVQPDSTDCHSSHPATAGQEQYGSVASHCRAWSNSDKFRSFGHAHVGRSI
jgi:signal transduction histidine kinase